MTENYDDICSLCGRPVEVKTLYYCCPECHRRHKEKQNSKQEAMEESEVKDEGV